MKNGHCKLQLQSPDLFPQLRDCGFTIWVIEDSAANDEPIDAGVRRRADGFGVKPAVHFQTLVLGQSLLDLPCLGQHFRHELLPAKTWENAHRENKIDMLDRRPNPLGRRIRIQRDPHAAAKLSDFLRRLRRVVGGFHMKGQILRPAFTIAGA